MKRVAFADLSPPGLDVHIEGWMEVMKELIDISHHRLTQDIYAQISWFGEHTSTAEIWGGTMVSIVQNRERRQATRASGRFPLRGKKLMTDTNIKKLMMTPGLSTHLLSFLNPKWFVGAVFDPHSWTPGPKHHVLPDAFTLQVKFYHTRFTLSDECQRHSVVETKAGKTWFRTTRVANSILWDLEAEYRRMNSNQLVWRRLWLESHWSCLGTEFIPYCQHVSQSPALRICASDTPTNPAKMKSRKKWEVTETGFAVPISRTVGSHHWTHNKRWCTDERRAKFFCTKTVELVEV